MSAWREDRAHRGDFDKGTICKPPGLKKENFAHKKRNRINKHLKMRYGRLFVTLPDIHFPDHYANDRVHLNT